MSPEKIDLEAQELNAQRILKDELHDYFEILAISWNSLAVILDSTKDYTLENDAQNVCYHLLSRICTDIRCIYLVAERGYPKQADGMAASVYEVARDIVIIGDNKEYASEWNTHSDEKQRFSNPSRIAYERFEDGLEKMTKRPCDNKMLINGAKHFYTQVCMSKHANLIIERYLACIPSNGNVSNINGPLITENAKQIIRHALLSASTMASLAMANFIQYHVRPALQEKHIQSVDIIRRRILQLSCHAMQIIDELEKQNPFGNNEADI